jgi:hypothetical protein
MDLQQWRCAFNWSESRFRQGYVRVGPRMALTDHLTDATEPDQLLGDRFELVC